MNRSKNSSPILKPDDFASLLSWAKKQHRQKNKIILANGAFDLLHVGHLRYLMDASSKADKLLVAINSDSSVKSLKGQNRPNVPQNERAELVSALSCVDLVFIFSSLTVNPIIEKVRPSFHAKGTDYTIENIPEKEFLNKFSVTPIICGDPKDHSTTEMMKQLKKNL